MDSSNVWQSWTHTFVLFVAIPIRSRPAMKGLVIDHDIFRSRLTAMRELDSVDGTFWADNVSIDKFSTRIPRRDWYK
jgi:hypothetical protein